MTAFDLSVLPAARGLGTGTLAAGRSRVASGRGDCLYCQRGSRPAIACCSVFSLTLASARGLRVTPARRGSQSHSDRARRSEALFMRCLGSRSFEVFDLECFYNLFSSSVRELRGVYYRCQPNYPPTCAWAAAAETSEWARRQERRERAYSTQGVQPTTDNLLLECASLAWHLPPPLSVPSTSPPFTFAIVIHIYIHSNSLAP